MTPVQILAVVSLLLAFGVPRDTVNNVQSIMEHAPAQQTIPQNASEMGAIINTPMPDLKPAYTLDQLMTVLLNAVPKSSKPLGYTFYRYWPVSVNPSATSAEFSFTNHNEDWDTIRFDGKDILTRSNAMTIWNGIGNNPWVAKIDGLTPNTQYTYYFVWHEAGREDTVISQTFTTLSQ